MKIDIKKTNDYTRELDIDISWSDLEADFNNSIKKFSKKVKNGEKYRLRANTKIGNKLSRYIDTSLLESLKGNVFRPFDYLLSFGKTSRQKTLFLSTKNCTFTKHAHIISGLILHLEGEKTWYISKKREKFSDIKYKRLLHPNPLYV
ncbi:trigger factor family protein, partial [Candidatus Marinimicrobia bacterium]|nr:trigger factor family protein [Candidatus Neomarinimicrobiota bacterium]